MKRTVNTRLDAWRSPVPASGEQIGDGRLQSVVRRIVELARPVQIILFGSAARNEIGPDSDYDLLVIMSGRVHTRQVAQELYRGLVGVGVASDIVVSTLDAINGATAGSDPVIRAALTEGITVYAA